MNNGETLAVSLCGVESPTVNWLRVLFRPCLKRGRLQVQV